MKKLNEYIQNHTHEFEYETATLYNELQEELEKDINDLVDLRLNNTFDPLAELYEEDETDEKIKEKRAKINSRKYQFIQIFMELCLKHYLPSMKFRFLETIYDNGDCGYCGYEVAATEDIHSVSLYDFNKFVEIFELNTNTKLDYEIYGTDDSMDIKFYVPEEYELAIRRF